MNHKIKTIMKNLFLILFLIIHIPVNAQYEGFEIGKLCYTGEMNLSKGSGNEARFASLVPCVMEDVIPCGTWKIVLACFKTVNRDTVDVVFEVIESNRYGFTVKAPENCRLKYGFMLLNPAVNGCLNLRV
jgi:hypothetical protein